MRKDRWKPPRYPAISQNNCWNRGIERWTVLPLLCVWPLFSGCSLSNEPPQSFTVNISYKYAGSLFTSEISVYCNYAQDRVIFHKRLDVNATLTLYVSQPSPCSADFTQEEKLKWFLESVRGVVRFPNRGASQRSKFYIELQNPILENQNQVVEYTNIGLSRATPNSNNPKTIVKYNIVQLYGFQYFVLKDIFTKRLNRCEFFNSHRGENIFNYSLVQEIFSQCALDKIGTVEFENAKWGLFEARYGEVRSDALYLQPFSVSQILSTDPMSVPHVCGIAKKGSDSCLQLPEVRNGARWFRCLDRLCYVDQASYYHADFRIPSIALAER